MPEINPISTGKVRVLVTGANGQLGKELKRLEPDYPGMDFRFLSREDLPIHHFELVRHFFEALRPDFLVNCAAYTAVDRAEEERDLAYQVNAEAVGVLAAICKSRGTRFIHLSTDYVFDGKGSRPYTPDSPTGPLNVYGATKLEGERQARQFDPECIILRSSWIYSEYGKNFIKTMLRLFREREEVGVVNDQYGSPTYAFDLAGAILKIITSPKFVPGIYHYCNEGVITWYQLAQAIRELTGLTCRVLPISAADFPTAAARPAYSALDTGLIREVFGIQPPYWKDSLATCLKRLQ